MHDFLPCGMDLRSCAHLQQAARICGDDDGSVGCARVLHFFRQDLERGFRLSNVVGARGPAAVIGHGHFDQFESRDGAHQLARSFTNFLSVQQMAGILIRHSKRQAGERRAQSQFGKKFRGVAHLFF